MNKIIPVEAITSRIFLLRGMKVILDRDLAELYGVTTKRLNEQMRRNRDRCPKDFLVELTVDEGEEVVLPLGYTEHGALMAASVLKSQRAVEMSIYVVRAFVELRQALATHEELRKKIEEMESRYDEQFRVVLRESASYWTQMKNRSARLRFETVHTA